MQLTIDEARRQLPSLIEGAYFNTGYCGPLPIPAAEAMRAELERDLAVPRCRADAYERECRLAIDAKRAFASMFEGVEVRDLVLTDSTTHGLGIVFAGLGIGEGDEIITTDEEHIGLGAVLAAAIEGWGAEVKTVPFRLDASTLADEIERAITDRTRIVAISHISYATGRACDPRTIADRLPDSVPLVLDGAHTPGAIAFNPGDSGVAAIAFPGQKWCLGPEGIGGLWVSPAWLDRIAPTAVSFRAMADWNSPTDYTFEKGAARFDGGTLNKPVVAGLIEAIRWLRDDVGLDRVVELTQTRADTARDALEGVGGVELLSPAGTLGGLVGFRLRGLETIDEYVDEAARLWDAGVLLRRIENPPGLRASVAWFNTDEEIEHLAAEVAAGA